MRSTCIVIGDFASFIYLMSQLLMASKLDDGKSSCSNKVVDIGLVESHFNIHVLNSCKTVW